MNLQYLRCFSVGIYFGIVSGIIYSIIYFHHDTLEKDIGYLLHKFESFFGKLKPKKIIDLYDDLMRSNDYEPILTFRHSGGIINCREISKEWKSIFRS